MRCELEVLSPLHIGSGEKISAAEYIIEDKFYRVNMEEMFKDEDFDIDAFINAEGRIYLGDFSPDVGKRHIRYAIDIGADTGRDLKERALKPSGDVHEFVKSVDRVYVPGSSIKGAIRTAIMWWVLKNDRNKFNNAEKQLRRLIEMKKVDRKHAGDAIEKIVFGEDPRKDVLRALQISDTNTVSVERLRVEEVRTLTTLRKGLREGHTWKNFYTFVEALKPGTKLEFDVRTDDFLFRRDVAEELGFEGKRYMLEIERICNEFAADFIEKEIEFFKKYNIRSELYDVVMFYEDLKEETAKDALILHLSWGSGWHGMTVTRLFDDLISDLRGKFRLGRREVSEFPKTRRIVFEGNRPKYPLGWVKVVKDKVAKDNSHSHLS